MNSAVINRQYLMGAVMASHPAISGTIHSLVPHTNVVQIGDLSELFSRELERVANVDISSYVNTLRSDMDNVGVWLNNFCRIVLPVLANLYKPV